MPDIEKKCPHCKTTVLVEQDEAFSVPPRHMVDTERYDRYMYPVMLLLCPVCRYLEMESRKP